ncbi:MAG TPA: YbhB/YbcL family Raf kinase inhibitor-like protein [Steroidobacteraceae bacterium]|nr:YbhB/YbcL family Raf kinase inhibitor-like protein [Steroidobacteraceae bacterium]
MRSRGFISRMAAALGMSAVAMLAVSGERAVQAGEDATGAASHFVLLSLDLPEHGMIHRRQLYYRCGGENVSPMLEWHNPPAGTQSFALLMHDPDAPGSQGFWHWIVYDIPATVSSLPAGAGDAHKGLMPAGAIQGRSDFGVVGYGGPCPPPGSPHRYVFRLYALPVAHLNVPPDATGTIIAAYAEASALGTTQLISLYGR